MKVFVFASFDWHDTGCKFKNKCMGWLNQYNILFLYSESNQVQGTEVWVNGE